MIYRETGGRFEGTWNRTVEWTAKRLINIYADGGMAEVETYLRDVPKKWGMDQSKSSPARDSWDLNVGYAGACKLAREGWQEGADNLDARLHAVIPAAGRESRWGYAQAGSSVKIGRYLTGHPMNMRSRRKKTMGSAPVLHIVINGTASCMVNAEQMANFGTALVGLIDRLENTGKRVHLDVVFVTRSGGDESRIAVGWNVKRASEHVDLSAVAFSVAHPAAFRRLGFALIERTPQACQDYGYGCCADLRHEDVPDATDATMLVDGINHEPGRCNSAKDALRFAVEQLNKAAVIAGHSTIDQPLIPEDEELFAY